MREDGGARYGLRGVVDGRERRFLLQAGINQVGSDPSGEVVLRARGVSRRHAVIDVAAAGVTLRDLASKNGTFHNGSRTGEACLCAGDAVRLGSVELTFEQISAREGEMALRFRPPRAGGREPAPEETSLLERESRRLLALVERLVVQLLAPRPATTAALATLVEACGASGAATGEWDGEHEPVVRSACGDVAAWSAVAGELLASLAPALSRCRTERRRLDQLYVCGGLERPGGGLLYLIVWGGAGERGLEEGWIPLFLRLLDRGAPAAAALAAAPAPAAVRDLVLPAGYVRGRSEAMQAVHAALAELAASELPVLVEGETGVGKELLVRALHASSRRAGRPWVAINCAAIPAELLEAELFGIRKGVATGVDERRGRFQQAAGGTLFLDEIADLPLPLQAKLLRVLQEREVQPVGGPAFALDARIVAATNRSLRQEVEQGRFRADLFYRIAGYVLRVPALRERREDIPLLVESLVQRAADADGKWVRGITVGALQAMIAHAWPGNVRELDHEARCLVQRCPEGSAIDLSMLSEAVQRAGAGAAGSGGAAAAGDQAVEPLDLQAAVESLERRLIRDALGRASGNRSQAARLLGISRNGLAEKMARLGIALQQTTVEGGGAAR